MVKAKRNVQQDEAPKKRVMPRVKSEAKVVAAPDSSLQFWQKEIDALQQQRFSSADEAVTALVDRVVERFREDGLGAAKMREFLTFLFDVDPELKAKVARVLHVRSARG